MTRSHAALAIVGMALALGSNAHGEEAAMAATDDPLVTGEFRWTAGPALVSPAERPDDPCFSVKDPSIVYQGGRWHLFSTIRSRDRTHQIEYITFADWADAGRAEHRILIFHPGYFCAPQVFYFEPQQRWYLICQASDEAWDPKYCAAYSTTTDIADPDSWSPLKPLGLHRVGDNAGLDFWVICDDENAYAFFTTLDGKLWREETALAQFPAGWSEPALAIEGDIFEAAHIYRLKGHDRYLALIEAQNGHGWRYFKAYLADRLSGEWAPLADTADKSFASVANVVQEGERWTDCISHGELLRSGRDQRLEVDTGDLRFVFQGVLDRDRADLPYGQIPWRLGMLVPETR